MYLPGMVLSLHLAAAATPWSLGLGIGPQFSAPLAERTAAVSDSLSLSSGGIPILLPGPGIDAFAFAEWAANDFLSLGLRAGYDFKAAFLIASPLDWWSMRSSGAAVECYARGRALSSAAGSLGLGAGILLGLGPEDAAEDMRSGGYDIGLGGSKAIACFLGLAGRIGWEWPPAASGPGNLRWGLRTELGVQWLALATADFKTAFMPAFPIGLSLDIGLVLGPPRRVSPPPGILEEIGEVQ